ncbi:MAG: DUF3333 domain-containing protein, partial [Pseudomonadota bacterium]
MATTDASVPDVARAHVRATVAGRLSKRYAAERRFQAYGLFAILLGLTFLVLLFTSIISNGWQAFLQTKISVPVELTASEFPADAADDPALLRRVNYEKLARTAMYTALGFDGRPSDRRVRREIHGLLSRGVDVQVRDRVLENPSLIGTSIEVPLLAHGSVDQFIKGSISRETPNNRRLISDRQMGWIDQLVAEGKLATALNWGLFEFGASSQPETAG